MDITNNKERQVVCVSNDVGSTFPGFDKEHLIVKSGSARHVGIRRIPMKHKCKGCIFMDYYQDMGASTPLCSRNPEEDLLMAFKRHSDPAPCKYHLTKAELRMLQDEYLKLKGEIK